jgi:hypothetical protein
VSKSLVLKAVSSDMKSYGGFQWPGVGGVAVADDWDASPTCGGGLHGWLNGVGDASCQSWSKSPDAKWLVLSVDTETLVDLWGKVKFPEAEVVHVGDKKSAGDVILATGFIGPVIGATVTGGDDATVTGGELPAMVIIDSVVRLLPGVLGGETSAEVESFQDDDVSIEYPQYTRPADFRGLKVPEVLQNGNHAAIAKWRQGDN